MTSFFQFLPYHYGPYSFCLDREMDALANQGYVDDCDRKHWSLTEIGRNTRFSVDQPVRADVWKVLRRFGKSSSSSLLRSVYESFPWFSVNSRVEQLENRPTADPAVYTAGYEGLSVDGFLNELMIHGIRRIIDVRRNPVARRFGFHKSTLARLASNVGIDYIHIPQLGIASDQRQELHTYQDRLDLFERYASTTLENEIEAIAKVASLVNERASALVCLESDPDCCHRSYLAVPVAKKTGLPVVHLGNCVHAAC